MKIKKMLRDIFAIGALTALGACNPQVKSDWTINKGDLFYNIHKEVDKITVRESEFPFNSQIGYIDNYPFGSLDIAGSAIATGRGMGFSIIRNGEKGFDEAVEHYRKKILPLLLERDIIYMSAQDERRY